LERDLETRKDNNTMTLDEILRDIHALEEDLATYERKYGVLSETFYEAYVNGEEPADDAWMLDWNDWAGVYEIWLRRRKQYQAIIQSLREHSQTLSAIIERTARREPLSVPA
jgi:hypothetical protein